MSTQIRLYEELAAVLILLTAFGLYTWHERSVGAQKIETADAKALQADKSRADAETALNLSRAATADAGAASAQKAVDAYVAAHPDGPVRLCHADSGLRPVPPGSAALKAPADAGTGPAAVRAVQDGTPGPDIGPGLDALVRAAAAVATLYEDRQQR